MEVLSDVRKNVVLNLFETYVDQVITMKTHNLPKVWGESIPVIEELDLLIDKTTCGYVRLIFGREGNTKAGKPLYKFIGMATEEQYSKLCEQFNEVRT